MKPQTYQRVALAASAFSFLVGSAIYLCFRSTNLLMFQLFPHGELPAWACNLRSFTYNMAVPEWLRFSLPDGLWLMSYLFLMDTIWGRQRSLYSLFFLIILPLAALIVEILQMLHVIPGVGDWMDVASYLLSTLIFLTIKYLSYEKRFQNFVFPDCPFGVCPRSFELQKQL